MFGPLPKADIVVHVPKLQDNKGDAPQGHVLNAAIELEPDANARQVLLYARHTERHEVIDG